MIEGTAQGLLGANWGDGHATDASLVSRLPASSNPNPFYSQLVNAPYANNAIISTHVYGCASHSHCRADLRINCIFDIIWELPVLTFCIAQHRCREAVHWRSSDSLYILTDRCTHPASRNS